MNKLAVDPVPVFGWLQTYGTATVFIGLVIILLFTYFWRKININTPRKCLYDPSSVVGQLNNIIHQIENLSLENNIILKEARDDIKFCREKLVAIRAAQTGNFRNRGQDDE